MFNIPVALLSGLYASYIIIYQSIPYEGIWFSIWGSDIQELKELSYYYKDLILYSLIGSLVYCYCIYKLALTKNNNTRLRQSLLLFSLLLIALFMLGKNLFYRHISIDLQRFSTSFSQTFPLGMATIAYSTWRVSQKHKTQSNVYIPPVKDKQPVYTGKEIYIVVIGESARSDRWFADLAQNKYEMNNSNAIKFSNVLSQANFTDASVPLLLTGEEALEKAKKSISIPLLAKAAHYQTVWIGNNKTFSFALQTDFSVLNEQLSMTATSLYKFNDNEMLPIIERTLQQGNEKICLFVHLIGSHFDYTKRYSKRFMQKKVNYNDYYNRNSEGHIEALRHAYDNSITATNSFLSQLIKITKQQNALSIILYTADHGENLYDDERNLFQHVTRHPSMVEVKVPFFIWASDIFINHYSNKWKNLNNNKDRAISNRSVFPTLIDLFNIQYEKEGMLPSLFQAYSDDKVRYVFTPTLELISEREIW